MQNKMISFIAYELVDMSAYFSVSHHELNDGMWEFCARLERWLNSVLLMGEN